MKQKLFVIFVTLMMCLTTIQIINHNDFEVKAIPGGDGGGENVTGLDFDFMWNVVEDLSYVVHNPSIYPDGVIHKGRAFGSEGDLWTKNYIYNKMNNNFNLSNVEELNIEPIDKPKYWLWYYNYIVDPVDFDLTINGNNYPFENDVPKNEVFPWTSGIKNFREKLDNMMYNK